MNNPDSRPLDLLLEAVNAMFTRVRHGTSEHAAAQASSESAHYIAAFWPHVARLIADDPRALGLSLPITTDGARRSLKDVRRAPEVLAAAGDDRLALAIVAPLRMMTEVLNAATAAWASELRAGDCPLPFAVEAERYVSLRMLLPLREGPAGQVGANAPTLVMGGTTTALTLCWNLLWRLPQAWRELHGTVIDRGSLEQLWLATRELMFRIGSGSLTAFVALASGCAPNPQASLWPGMQELTLVRDGERHAWMMSAALFERVVEIVGRIHTAQQGHYVGCAALYARGTPLALAAAHADAVEDVRQAVIFAELLRWMTAVARAEYFPLFPPPR